MPTWPRPSIWVPTPKNTRPQSSLPVTRPRPIGSPALLKIAPFEMTKVSTVRAPNAGVSRGTLTDHAEDLPAFRSVFDTNVMGIVNAFQPFIAAMRAARRGALVGIASVAGFRGIPGSGAYSASKAAAIAYLESLRVELHGSGVAVVTIYPGYVATPLTAKNPYRIPFLIDPDDAARRIARAIAARRRLCVVPWPMAIAGRAFALLPRPLYDRMLAKAPRKPRRAD